MSEAVEKEGQGGCSHPWKKFGRAETSWCRKTLLPKYLTIPMTWAHILCPQTTQELPKNTWTPPEHHLNNYQLIHCHKSKVDTLDTVKVALPTNNAKGILENLRRGMRMAEWKMSPPPSSRPAASGCFTNFHLQIIGDIWLTEKFALTINTFQ